MGLHQTKKEAFVQRRKPSTEGKDSILTGRRYLQTYPIRS